MSITVTAVDLADLVAQVAALSGGAAAPADKPAGRGGKAKETTPPADDAPKGPTVEEIRELASGIELDDDQEKAVKVLEDAGVESISELGKKDAKTRQAAYDAIKEIVEAATKKAKKAKLG
jgi:hypothetical protein